MFSLKLSSIPKTATPTLAFLSLRYFSILLLSESVPLAAKAEAEANKMKRESEQDYDLDKLSMIAMDKSWKDEFLLILFSIPIAMCFFPEYRQYVEDGFKTLNIIPEWFMYIYVTMIVVIYGLRGLLRMFLQLMIDKIGFKK